MYRSVPKCRQHGECYHLINSCRSLIHPSDWEFHLVHCYREGNKVADRLANVGVVQAENVMYYNAPPHSILSLLREDITGVTTPHFVS